MSPTVTLQVQVVTLSANSALSGEFIVVYPGIGSSAPLAHDAPQETFATAIQSLGSDIGKVLTVSRERTGVRGYSWTVTFNDLSVGDCPQMIPENVSLKTRGNGTFALGAQTLVNGSKGIGGTFELKFSEDGDGSQDQSTGPLNHDSTARELEIAIEALDNVRDVSVNLELLHGGDGGRVFSIIWPRGAGDIAKLRVNGTGLLPRPGYTNMEVSAGTLAYVNEVGR